LSDCDGYSELRKSLKVLPCRVIHVNDCEETAMELPDKKALIELYKAAADSGEPQIVGLAESVIESAAAAEGALLRFEAAEGGLTKLLQERKGAKLD